MIVMPAWLPECFATYKSQRDLPECDECPEVFDCRLDYSMREHVINKVAERVK